MFLTPEFEVPLNSPKIKKGWVTSEKALQAMRDCLKINGGMFAHEVVGYTGYSQPSVSKAMKALHANGEVIRNSAGYGKPVFFELS